MGALTGLSGSSGLDGRVGGGGRILYDTFTEGSDVDLPSHSPDIDSLGGGWTKEIDSAAWNVCSANGWCEIGEPGEGVSARVNIDVGTALVDVTVQMYLPNAGNWHNEIGVGGDGAGGNVGLMFQFWNTNTSKFTRNGTLLWQGGWPTQDNDWHTIRVTVTPSGVWTVYLDGNQHHQETGVDLTSLGTRVVFTRGNDGVTTYKMDDLVVVGTG